VLLVVGLPWIERPLAEGMGKLFLMFGA
jgi:hypothetical protein